MHASSTYQRVPSALAAAVAARRLLERLQRADERAQQREAWRPHNTQVAAVAAVPVAVEAPPRRHQEAKVSLGAAALRTRSTEVETGRQGERLNPVKRDLRHRLPAFDRTLLPLRSLVADSTRTTAARVDPSSNANANGVSMTSVT